MINRLLTKPGYALLLAAVIMAYVSTIEYNDKVADHSETGALTDCKTCHQKMALAKYFEQAGSKAPEQMAEAVLVTKRPRLMAAIAKVESNGNPHIRNTGYKNRYSGAWQTGKHWGKVTADVTEQALIAEFALESHIKDAKGNLKRGLNGYGGDSTDRYSRKILAELERVP